MYGPEVFLEEKGDIFKFYLCVCVNVAHVKGLRECPSRHEKVLYLGTAVTDYYQLLNMHAIQVLWKNKVYTTAEPSIRFKKHIFILS